MPDSCHRSISLLSPSALARPASPAPHGPQASRRRPKPAPLPASPLSDTHFLEQVTCRGAPSLPTPAPPPRLGLRVAAAPSDRAGQAQRCPHCPVSLASGHRKPDFRPRTLCSAPRARGAPSSRGQWWARAPGICSGSAGGREEARGRRGRSRCGLGGGGYSRLRTDGAGGGEV